jgi:hypothetical protein
MSGKIFAVSGLLAHHHDSSVSRALAEDGLCASLVKIAALAMRSSGTQGRKGTLPRKKVRCRLF